MNRERSAVHEPLANGASDQAPPDVAVDWWAMLADPDYLASPYARLRPIREAAAVHCDAATGIYFVLGHDAFRRMAATSEMGRDTRLWTQGWNRPENREGDPVAYALFSQFQPQMTNANLPDHRRMRSVYEKAFRPADLAPVMALVADDCRRLLGDLPTGRPVDFMATVAHPLARSFARHAFQIPPAMEEPVAEWIAALGWIGNIIMSPQQKRDALTALQAFRAYLKDRLAARSDRPGEGLVGLALSAADTGAMDEDETLNNLVTLIAGGTATATLLGNGLLTLLRHPAEHARLRADRSLMRSAIEEMLRFEPGCSFIIRVAIRDFECGGVCIPAGALAIALMGATNRDPATFRDPDVFDIARQPNPHDVFGAGPHICIGKAVVRRTAELAFAGLLDRFACIDLAGEPVWWTHRSDQHGLHSLPIRLEHA